MTSSARSNDTFSACRQPDDPSCGLHAYPAHYWVLYRFQRNIVYDCEALTEYDISALRNAAKTLYDLELNIPETKSGTRL